MKNGTTGTSPNSIDKLRPESVRDSERKDLPPDALRVEVVESRERLGDLAEELGERLEGAQTVVEKTLSPLDWIKQHKSMIAAGAVVALGATTLLGFGLMRTRLVRGVLAVLLRRPRLLLPP